MYVSLFCHCVYGSPVFRHCHVWCFVLSFCFVILSSSVSLVRVLVHLFLLTYPRHQAPTSYQSGKEHSITSGVLSSYTIYFAWDFGTSLGGCCWSCATRNECGPTTATPMAKLDKIQLGETGDEWGWLASEGSQPRVPLCVMYPK